MGNASEKKKEKDNAETLLYAKIFIAVCHVRAAPPRLRASASAAADGHGPLCVLARAVAVRRSAHLLPLRHLRRVRPSPAGRRDLAQHVPADSLGVCRPRRWPRTLYFATLAVTVFSYLWMAGSSGHVVAITECCSCAAASLSLRSLCSLARCLLLDRAAARRAVQHSNRLPGHHQRRDGPEHFL